VSGGLSGNIMRTPGQRQQNFAVEGLMNEAGAFAGAMRNQAKQATLHTKPFAVSEEPFPSCLANVQRQVFPSNRFELGMRTILANW